MLLIGYELYIDKAAAVWMISKQLPYGERKVNLGYVRHAKKSLLVSDVFVFLADILHELAQRRKEGTHRWTHRNHGAAVEAVNEH